LAKAGRLPDAIGLYEKILVLEKPLYDADSSQTPPTADLLARAYRDTGRIADAIKLGEATLPLRQSIGSGRLTPEIILGRQASTGAELALSYHAAGRVSDAVRLGQEVRQDYEKLAQIEKGLAPRKTAQDRAEEWRHTLEQWDKAGAAPKTPGN